VHQGSRRLYSSGEQAVTIPAGETAIAHVGCPAGFPFASGFAFQRQANNPGHMIRFYLTTAGTDVIAEVGSSGAAAPITIKIWYLNFT